MKNNAIEDAQASFGTAPVQLTRGVRVGLRVAP
jgi:hypothetical protein